MRLVRNTMLALAAVGFAIVAVPSCDDDGHDDANCDYVVRRCRTFCDYGYGCDYYWGCCYDRCWYDCVGSSKPDPAPNVTPPPASSTPTPNPPATDAGPAPAPSGDFAVLCAPCTSNDQCKGGGLCITRGGEDAGATGFCGHPCAASSDCPADFTCTQIGESKQCVPANGTCN
jgi:hypothetical protein